MLRIHFTDADLARVHVAPKPDPLWELVLSLHRFQTRDGRGAVLDWYHDVRASLPARGLTTAVRSQLMPIAPRALYFPDFLTPPEAHEGFAAGLDAVTATPRAELHAQLGKVAANGGLSSWARTLAEGAPRTRRELGQVLSDYHDTAIAPYWEDIGTEIASDRTRRSRDLMDGGVDGLLRGFEPMMRWDPPVLNVDYAVESELHLRGRGIRLVPSYFCWKRPVGLADHELPPVLVYPLHNGALRALRGATPRDSRALRALLGATRAAVLEVAATGMTTTEIATRLGITPAAASHHTRVLRDTGLIVTTRDRQHVLHTITATGAALLASSTG